MLTTSISRRRIGALGLTAALTLAACGGSDEEGAGTGATSSGSEAPSGSAASDDAPAVSADAQLVDLIGPDVAAESDTAGNLLPDVVVDDVSTGRKVNFRNLIPQDKPVLLWMYAPH